MDKKAIYILNQEYKVKADDKRAVLFTKSTAPIIAETVSDFLAIIHQVFGILFSFFDGKNTLSTPK